jgi:hypothetical protein
MDGSPPKYFPAKAAPSNVLEGWKSQTSDLPVLLENRIEILRQALNLLDPGE